MNITPQQYIYAIGPTSGQGPVKIGRTNNNPYQRLSSLQTGHPDRLKVINYAPVFDSSESEQYIHMKLNKFRLQGEWFDIPHEDAHKLMEFFKNINLQVANDINTTNDKENAPIQPKVGPERRFWADMLVFLVLTLIFSFVSSALSYYL